MKKRIASVIILSIVALLAIAVIVLYAVKVNYTQKLDNPDRIVVYQTSTKWDTFKPDSEVYKNVQQECDNSFTQNLLSAIFAGQTGVATNKTTTGELPTVVTMPASSNYIVYDYDEGHYQTFFNGKENDTITQIYFVVTNSTSFESAEVYYKKTSGNYYYMKTIAKQTSLFDYITNLTLPEQPSK